MESVCSVILHFCCFYRPSDILAKLLINLMVLLKRILPHKNIEQAIRYRWKEVQQFHVIHSGRAVITEVPSTSFLHWGWTNFFPLQNSRTCVHTYIRNFQFEFPFHGGTLTYVYVMCPEIYLCWLAPAHRCPRWYIQYAVHILMGAFILSKST